MTLPVPHPIQLIPCPQHPKAGEPCCLKCGHRDGRTAAGAIFCHECHDVDGR